jgi:hypothetical protein
MQQLCLKVKIDQENDTHGNRTSLSTSQLPVKDDNEFQKQYIYIREPNFFVWNSSLFIYLQKCTLGKIIKCHSENSDLWFGLGSGSHYIDNISLLLGKISYITFVKSFCFQEFLNCLQS